MQDLVKRAEDAGISIVYDKGMPEFLSGLYVGALSTIVLRPGLSSVREKCVLAEELGHAQTGFCDGTECSAHFYQKQERLAEEYAIRLLVPQEKLLQALEAGNATLYDVSRALEVTPEMVQSACRYYARKGCIWALNIL